MPKALSRGVQGMWDGIRLDHEAEIVEEQAKADDAAAAGHEWMRKFHQDSVDRLKAMKLPGDD